MLLIAVSYRRCGRNLRAKLYTAINSLSANHAYLETLYSRYWYHYNPSPFNFPFASWNTFETKYRWEICWHSFRATRIHILSILLKNMVAFYKWLSQQVSYSYYESQKRSSYFFCLSCFCLIFFLFACIRPWYKQWGGYLRPRANLQRVISHDVITIQYGVRATEHR